MNIGIHIAALTMAGMVVCSRAADSAPFMVDNVRPITSESLVLTWNSEWVGGDSEATVVIVDDGVEIRRSCGSGEYTLNVPCGTEHNLEYITYVEGVKQSETYTTTVTMPHNEAITKLAKESTCTEDGWTREVRCNRCDEILEESESIPALGHNLQVTVQAQDSKCTEDGCTEQIACSRCGEIFVASEVIPALGHSGAITKPAIEPTSSETGWTAEITCTRCGEILQESEVIPALGYIRNVTARQLWPHKKIEVCYMLAKDIGDVATTNTPLVLMGKWSSTTKTATALYGDMQCVPGVHKVVWDFDADSITHSTRYMSYAVKYGAHSALSADFWVAADVKDGMDVSATIPKYLGYSTFANGESKLILDDETLLSSTNSGSFGWMPRSVGQHTLKHISGTNEWTRAINVTAIPYAQEPSPNPSTEEDANIAISSTSKAFGVNGGSGTIVTGGSGTWSAEVSDSWITIPSALASRNAGLPVVYQVAANTEVEARTGYIYVSGHVFTVTQEGVGAELDEYSADIEANGGTGSFTVLADTQSSWRVKSNVDWISVKVTDNGERVTGNGEQDVFFSVAPWNEVSTRSGTITAAGQTFTVNQTGRRMKIYVPDAINCVPLAVEKDYLSHVIDIQVNALAETEWGVAVDSPWLSIVDGGSGKGSDNIAIAINENPSFVSREGKVIIGTETLVIKQSGRTSEALQFEISPTNTTASVKGANGLISVLATPDLPWTATSQANWLTIMPAFQSGAGNGNIIYTASPNPTMAKRTGTIEVAPSGGMSSRIHAVSQPAATALISATNHIVAAEGESFDIEVAIDDVVNWTIDNTNSWITISGELNRYGPGRVSLVATENMTVDPREATIIIAGHAFTIHQQGRTVEVEYTSKVFGTETDYGSIEIHPDGNISWKAVSSDPTWLTIWGDEGCEYDDDGNVIGTGDATIEYIVSDYVGDGTPRTGTITIGDKVVYITQRAYDLSINPSATWVGGNSGEGEIGVPATVGQIWNAIATEPWIAIASGYDEGTGSGTVRFVYTDNDTGAERTGRIIISGEEYTITQAARQMVAVSSRIDGGKGHISGGGTYDRGSSVILTAKAQDGYEFVSWTLPDGSVATSTTLQVVADVDKEIIANFRMIPIYSVNGESVREGTSRTFAAPADVIDENGTRKLVCLGTSRYPDKGASFTLVVTEDVDFAWDIWQTNYLVKVEQTEGGSVTCAGIYAGEMWISAGEEIELAASPETEKTFFRWLVDDSPATGMSPPHTLRLCINSPLSISAVFGVFNDTIATAADAPMLTFTTGGDAEWAPVIDATTPTGYTSARSGTIGEESETWLETTIAGAGALTFRWRVDCEKDDGGGATWDRLSVWTNGVEAARIDGKTDWQIVTINCEPHDGDKTTIRWSFYRDDWDEPGASHENAAWVDGIDWKEVEQ